VVGDETYQPRISTDRSQVACPIESVKSGVNERRGVPDVMKHGGPAQQLAAGGCSGSDLAGYFGHAHGMPPSAGERLFEQEPGELPRLDHFRARSAVVGVHVLTVRQSTLRNLLDRLIAAQSTSHEMPDLRCSSAPG
jgi:hypothetical protein